MLGIMQCDEAESEGNSSKSADVDDVDSRSLKRKSIFARIKSESEYQKKFVLTLAVCWSYVNLAAVVLQIGTALPSLQRLVDVDLETAAWLFTTWSLGFVAGSLLCGVLYDKINRLIVMFFCTLGAAVCTAFLPFCNSFMMMIVVRVITGISCGGIDTGANTIMPSIWGSECGPFMHTLYLAYTVGGILIPFATEPFMIVEKSDQGFIYSPINKTSHINYFVEQNMTDLQNLLHPEMNLNHTSADKKFVSNEVAVGSKENSIIHYAFILTACFSMTAAVWYLVMAIIGGFDRKSKDSMNACDRQYSEQEQPLKEDSKDVKDEPEVVIEMTDNKITGSRMYLVLTCVAGVNFLYSSIEDSLGDFLVTFCLDYLGWKNSSAVFVMSLYWVTSCLGGLSGIVLVKWLRSGKLLFVAHLCWITTFLVSVFASIFRIDVLIWMFMPCSGFFMVLIIPAAMSWTEENVCHITGKISSLFMLATGTGISANPKFIGYMMEKYSYACFTYILFAESVICFAFYVMAHVVRHIRYKSARQAV